MTNCRDCKFWDVRETLRTNPQLPKLGFAKCKLDTQQARYLVAGYHCGKWEQAEQVSIDARKKVGAY